MFLDDPSFNRIQLNGQDYWRFKPRKYSLSYKRNHLLCDARFQPSPEKPEISSEEEKDELEKINERTRKSLMGQSNLF